MVSLIERAMSGGISSAIIAPPSSITFLTIACSPSFRPPSRRGSFLVFLDLAPRLHGRRVFPSEACRVKAARGGEATPENGANLDLLRFYSSLSQRFVRESGATVTRVPLNKHPLPSVSGETASVGAADGVRSFHRQVNTEIFLSPSALIADPLF